MASALVTRKLEITRVAQPNYLYLQVLLLFFRLDPALIRPGRVDLKEYIGYCTTHQLKKMFCQFYQITDEDLLQKFSDVVQSRNLSVSPAQIQGYFMRHKCDTPYIVTENINEIWEGS